MKTVIKRNIGKQGEAEVRVLKDNLRVVFPDGDAYVVSKEGWTLPQGRYSITLNKMGDAIKYVSPPPSRTELVRFAEFANRVGKTDKEPGVPEPSIKRGGPRQGVSKSGKPYNYYQEDELAVTARLEIIGDSPYAGLDIIYQFPYAFENVPGTQLTQLTLTQARLVRLEEFFRLLGFDVAAEEIPWSSNVLPFLEERFKKEGKVFQVTTNDKGFVSQFASIPDFLLPPELVGKKKAKTKAKKPTKK